MLVLLYFDCWNIEGVVATYEYEVILNAKINKWHSCHWCTKSELQLLIGSVNNTVSVIGPLSSEDMLSLYQLPQPFIVL